LGSACHASRAETIISETRETIVSPPLPRRGSLERLWSFSFLFSSLLLFFSSHRGRRNVIARERSGGLVERIMTSALSLFAAVARKGGIARPPSRSAPAYFWPSDRSEERISRRNCPPCQINMSDAGKPPYITRSTNAQLLMAKTPRECVPVFRVQVGFSLGIARFMTARFSTSRLIFNLSPTNEPYLPAAFL